MWEGEINVCKVLVPIKVVLVENDYLLYPKFELHRYQQMNWFLYWRSFYWKKIWCTYLSRAHCSANTNLNLIRSTYSKSNLATKSPVILSYFNFVSLNQHNNLKASSCRALFWCFCVYFEQAKYQNNESKSKQHEIISLIN